MVASQSHVLHWQRCTAAAAAAPGATGGHGGVGSHVADAENSGAPPSPLPSPVATSALNEGLVVGQPLPLFRAFLFLSSDGNPLLSLSSPSGLDRFLSPSFPVYLFSRGRRRPAFGGRDGRGERRRWRARSAKLVTFQSCNALWTHAPTSRAVNLRTTRLFIIEEYERL